ncbi:hypothetical protein JOC77_002039 [Peribacillus deserti]|uniref:YpoC-like domain-containing protein n=1 Tax=Peribacillus deserti TaxID=673318 RepID=A0ABS2QIJ2_9BACI|nr:hypothetical protein [Peribacillus deserti]MBM7692609.1 hypothetical protein [Peribacillus deserti]
MTNLILATPNSLVGTIYFKETVQLSREELKVWTPELLVHHYFPYEICFYNSIESFAPWEHAEKVMPDLLALWHRESKVLADLFSLRKTDKAFLHMKRAISIWISALFWINSRPVCVRDWSNQGSELALSPINAAERLTFILERPVLFHAYKQLNILFQELEKMFYKQIAIKNRLR